MQFKKKEQKKYNRRSALHHQIREKIYISLSELSKTEKMKTGEAQWEDGSYPHALEKKDSKN